MLNRIIGTMALLLAAPAIASDAPVAVASYPHGNFLENMAVTPQGGLIFTSYVDRRIMRWSGAGEPTAWSTLDVHPVAVLARARDVIVTAHGRSFLDGPAFATTQQFLVLDLRGRVVRRVDAPDARFLNGLVQIGPDAILAADSAAGRIWRFTPSNGALTPWLDDPLLGQGAPSQRPGVNGLKLLGGWLYLSNSARGAIYRIRTEGGRPSGKIELYTTTGPVDDFAFLADGSIAAATHGARLIRVAVDGTISSIMVDGCDSCTAVLPFKGRLMVTTTGNLLEQGTAPARLLRLPIPTNRKGN